MLFRSIFDDSATKARVFVGPEAAFRLAVKQIGVEFLDSDERVDVQAPAGLSGGLVGGGISGGGSGGLFGGRRREERLCVKGDCSRRSLPAKRKDFAIDVAASDRCRFSARIFQIDMNGRGCHRSCESCRRKQDRVETLALKTVGSRMAASTEEQDKRDLREPLDSNEIGFRESCHEVRSYCAMFE